MSKINNFIGGLLLVAASGSATAQALPPVPPISDSFDRTLYQMHRDKLVDDQYFARAEELVASRRLASDRCFDAHHARQAQDNYDMAPLDACLDHATAWHNSAEAALNRWQEAEHARSFNARWQR